MYNCSIRLGIGNRRQRKIAIIKNEKPWIQNIFQLSSGEALLLDLFLCIIRDFDLSESTFNSLSDINGIVLIDEIDLHLHVHLQNEILPKLLKMFPKIQFIITTHSSVFLLGMQKIFKQGDFDIIEMPSAESVSTENFTEFVDVFSLISETRTFFERIDKALRDSAVPVVFAEGEYDVKYILRTIDLFYKDYDLLSKFKLCDAGGFGGLDKIWSSMNTKVADILFVEVLLLYDCDVKKTDGSRGKAIRKIIPTVEDNAIKKGIENLFCDDTVLKLQKENKSFIDITNATTKTKRGIPEEVPEQKEVNKDEKRNICDWLCLNGEPSDFEGFKVVVDMIVDFLGKSVETHDPIG